MLVVIGYIIVLASVFGGYAMAGGHLAALFQPNELLIIAGAGLGSFVVGNNSKAIKSTMKALPMLVKGSKYTKELYMELMALLYVLLAKARKDGMLAIEGDVEDPASSPVFSQYPRILGEPRIMEFLTDYLRLMVSGNMNAFEIENLMDHEIETYRHEGEVPGHCLQKMADAMPAFGIVAAVMGVVHTMASADQPPAVLGALIAQALVGTFLGILLAYGFIAPLAQLIEHRINESVKLYECIKVTLLASLNGYAPALSVEFGRKVLYSTVRPSFAELEEHVRQVKAR